MSVPLFSWIIMAGQTSTLSVSAVATDTLKRLGRLSNLDFFDTAGFESGQSC